MDMTLLKKICETPTYSGHEDLMVNFITGLVKAGGERRFGRCYVDHCKNVFIVKGSAKYSPCVAAHIDSVQPLRNVSVYEEAGMLKAVHDGKQVGFGADDKSGVYVCLELLQRFDNIMVAFFAQEEIGCRGAYGANSRIFDKMGYLLEFDCPSQGLMSYTSGGERMFENQGEFIQTALPVLQKHGIVNWQRHPYSDTMAVRRRTNLSCLNLSSGYYNWHADNEYIRISDTASAIDSAVELVQVLGPNRYRCDIEHEDKRLKPLLEIQPLRVVDKLLFG